jgi:hypothetical protein
MKIRIVSNALGYPTEHDGQFLKNVIFDVDPIGRAAIETTPIEAEGMDFEDTIAAWEFWRTQSKRMPLRPDGKPNRPLTAYTIELENKL